MSYTLYLSRPAVKMLDLPDRSTERRIRAGLRRLESDPYDPRLSKHVANVEGLRSSKIGDWRILYTVNEDRKAIYVVAIRPCGEAYRGLSSS